MSLSRFSRGLGYQFADEDLLVNALTHRSHSSPHNERLEFLGDGLLNCIVAAELYRRYPQLSEGDLSRMRANLVRQEALHRLAQNLHLGEVLRLGEGEMKSGGHQRPSILADALEAVIGAVFLDKGFEAAQSTVLRIYASLFDEMAVGARAKDPKTRLQEWLQARKKPLPRYVLQGATGLAHNQSFEVACEVEGLDIRAVGHGGSRKLAEQAAAESALKALNA